MREKFKLLCATAIAGGLYSAAARAQTAPAPAAAPDAGPKPLTEVVVTANRRSQRILDVPYNITAVSGKTVDDDLMQNSAELLRSVPGVSLVDRGPRNQGTATNIQMRGVNVDSAAVGDYTLPSVAPVATYVNDTPLFANFALIDLARVEVLRGPQGTLYGSGALGGTVRYIYNEPQFDRFSGSITATATHVDPSDGVGQAYDAVVNIPVAHNLAIRLNGVFDDYPGTVSYVNLYQTGPGGIPLAPEGIFSSAASYTSKKDADTAQIGFGRIAVRWDPVSSVDFTLTYAHQHDQIGGRRQVTTGDNGYGVPYGRYENGAVILEPSARTVDLLALESTVDFGFATLTSSTSWYDHTGSSTTDNTGFYANDATFHNYYYNYPRPDVPAYRRYGDQAYVEEVRLVSKPGKIFDWVVGAYVNRDKAYQAQDDYVLGFQQYINAYFGLPANSTLVASSDHQFTYRAYEHTTDAAAFGELTWHVTDAWQVTGGLRHFRTDQDTNLLIDFPAYTVVSDPDAPPTIKQPSEKTLFKGNTSYKFSDDNLIYATVSQGYRRGGVNEVATIGRWAEDPRWQTYAPDQVVNYEAGAKGRFMGVTYDAALFYVDWTRIQLNTFTDNYGFYAVANGARARSTGLELLFEGAPLPRFHYSLGYTLTDAELTANFYSPTAILIAEKGAMLPGTPKDAVTLATDYTVPLPNGSTLAFHVNGYYQSKTQNAVGHPSYLAPDVFEATLPGFQLWNVTATWSVKRVDLSLFVKNLFNANGVTGEFTQAYTGTNPGYPSAANPGAANFYGNDAREFISLQRTVGLAANYHW
jgi:outer membrane receptor protein involved in Fe transport